MKQDFVCAPKEDLNKLLHIFSFIEAFEVSFIRAYIGSFKSASKKIHIWKTDSLDKSENIQFCTLCPFKTSSDMWP